MPSKIVADLKALSSPIWTTQSLAPEYWTSFQKETLENQAVTSEGLPDSKFDAFVHDPYYCYKKDLVDRYKEMGYNVGHIVITLQRLGVHRYYSRPNLAPELDRALLNALKGLITLDDRGRVVESEYDNLYHKSNFEQTTTPRDVIRS